MPRTCRRNAPPGFRAAPRAASMSSRPCGFNPFRLRACGAARFACLQGIGARPIPAARCLAPLKYHRTGYAGSARPALRRDGRGAGEHAGACCGRFCGCVPPSTLAVLVYRITKDGSRTHRSTSLCSFHATLQDRHRKVRQGRSRLSSERCLGPHQGASQ